MICSKTAIHLASAPPLLINMYLNINIHLNAFTYDIRAVIYNSQMQLMSK